MKSLTFFSPISFLSEKLTICIGWEHTLIWVGARGGSIFGKFHGGVKFSSFIAFLCVKCQFQKIFPISVGLKHIDDTSTLIR